MSSVSQQTVARGDRRRARTRQRLINAARSLLTEPGYSEKSIAEITERADVGLGSFYNHFSSKAELFDAAVIDVLDEHERLLDEKHADVEDVALRMAIAVRSTGRLVITHPEIAKILQTIGMSLLDAEAGLAPRARQGLAIGIKTGRFADIDVELLVAAMFGSLLGLLHLWLRDPDQLDESWCDAMTERILVMCGIDAAEAHDLAHRPF